MKKLLALLLVAVMCLFLAACGSKEDYSGKWKLWIIIPLSGFCGSWDY